MLDIKTMCVLNRWEEICGGENRENKKRKPLERDNMKNIWWTVEIFAKSKFYCFDVKAKTISEAMKKGVKCFCDEYEFDATCLQEFSISVETFEEKHKDLWRAKNA